MVHVTFHYFFMFSRVSKKPPKKVETWNQTCTKGTTHIAAVRLPSLLDPQGSIERSLGSQVYRKTYLGARHRRNGSEAKAGEIVGVFPVFQKKKRCWVGCESWNLPSLLTFLGEDTIENHFWFRFWVNWFQGVPWIFFETYLEENGWKQKTMSESWGVDDKGSMCHLHWRPGVFWKSQSSRMSSSFLPGHEDLSRTTPEITKNYRKV